MPPRPSQLPQAVRELKPAGPAGTLFLVHPGALDATVHLTLARALPDTVGLTVLDLSGVPEYADAAFTGGHAETTIEALADRLLVDLVRARNGQRDAQPYALAGWSFGGVVVQAMVERQAADTRPGRLVLLDSIAPTQAYQPGELEPSLILRWFALYLGAKRGRPVTPDPGQLANRGHEDGLLVIRDVAVASGALRPDTPIFGLRKLYETYTDGLLRNNRLTMAYRPSPATVPLVLVRADQGLIPGDETLGWDELAARGLTTVQSPGDHYTMLTRPDAASVIAQQVRLP
jgi:thioesterase domain-containing protein